MLHRTHTQKSHTNNIFRLHLTQFHCCSCIGESETKRDRRKGIDLTGNKNTYTLALSAEKLSAACIFSISLDVKKFSTPRTSVLSSQVAIFLCVCVCLSKLNNFCCMIYGQGTRQHTLSHKHRHTQTQA